MGLGLVVAAIVGAARQGLGVLGALLILAPPAGAGVPCLVSDEGIAFRWERMPVVYNLGRGPVAVSPARVIGAEEGAELIELAGQVWEQVPAARVRFAAGAALPVDGAPVPYLNLIGRCGDGLSPVIFDPSGAIVDAVFGGGASEFVLGFTVHDCGDLPAPRIPESSVVINGAPVAALGSDPVGSLVGVTVHEFGHVLNLCHSLLHGEFADDGDVANDAFLPIMFPFRSGDDPAGDPTPRFDDWSMLSMLYPEPEFLAGTGTLGGHVLSGERRRPVSGTAVIIRSTIDPLATAQWTTSGWLRFERYGDLIFPDGELIAAIDGSYQASGLPPGSYTVEVDGGINGESREFYSGPSESGDPVSDPPELATPVDVGAGGVRTDVTIELDRQIDSPLAETEWEVTWRGRLKVGRRAPRFDLPQGQLEFLSTGNYRVTPTFVLGGRWMPQGQRRVTHVADGYALEAALDPGGGEIEITDAKGWGRVNRGLTRIRGRIVAHGRTLSFVGKRFKIRFSYRGRRSKSLRLPGRLPVVTPPSTP